MVAVVLGEGGKERGGKASVWVCLGRGGKREREKMLVMGNCLGRGHEN